MNTPLQRLVDLARGAPQHPTLRIEPLLGTPFAMPGGTAGDLGEADIETDPPASTSTSSPAFNPVPRRQSGATTGRPAATHQADSPSLPDIPRPAPTPTAVAGAVRATARPARQRRAGTTNTVPGPEIHQAGAEHLGMQARPTRGRSLLRPATSFAPIPAAPLQHAPISTVEPTPGITIAIGRVEVRSAPTAAEPPRRPFKPGLSLDAFLRRGKGDG